MFAQRQLPIVDRVPRLALAVFFASGFAALLYQVIWQRFLILFSGADVHSVTIIVAAFMGGLGAGSLAGGHLADRLGPQRSLWMFAAAEVGVGLFGVASKALYYDLLYTRYGYLAAAPATAAVVLFASLLIPTMLMGLSLPLLARALTPTVSVSGRVIGSLYGWNTLGAASGAFVATWLLLPRLGLEGSLWIGAAANFSCAAAALALGAPRVSAAAPPLDDDGNPPQHPATADVLSFRTWVFVYALTGFIALALEIVWFRLLGVMLKSTAFTFGTLLAIYLAGLGLGSALAARRVARSTRPGATFLALQYGITVYAALSTVGLMALLDAGHPIKLVRYLGEYDPVDVYARFEQLRMAAAGGDSLTAFVDFAILYLVVPAALVGVPTIMMGACFPFLQRATQIDLPHIGRRLGALLAANIGGGVAGATIAGLFLLPIFGSAGSLKALVGLGALLAWPLMRVIFRDRAGATMAAGVAATAASIALALTMPDAERLWARLHSASPAQVLFAEDAAGLSLLKAERGTFAGPIGVYVNGLGQSWIPFGNIHTVLGALPVLLHPHPREVAIIGLGSGDTVFAAAARAETVRVTCVEIIAKQRDTLARLTRIQSYPGLVALLADPRVEHHAGDGRAYVQHAGRRFDVIEADALRPTSAFAGNLYSQEYFELLRRGLTTGGLAVTWAPTERIRQTFASVFPHVLALGDIYIGSDAPIGFDPAVLRARAQRAHGYFAAAGIDIESLLSPYLESPPTVFGPGDQRTVTGLNTDTFPRDEFALPY